MGVGAKGLFVDWSSTIVTNFQKNVLTHIGGSCSRIKTCFNFKINIEYEVGTKGLFTNLTHRPDR